MTIDQYHDEWKKDAPVPPDDLDASSRNVPYLHAKWWRYYDAEKRATRRLDLAHKTLYHQKHLWYSGKLLDDDRKKLGWPANPLKILPAAVGRHIDADKDIQASLLVKSDAEETLRFLEDVIASINKRSYYIGNAISYLQFKMGV